MNKGLQKCRSETEMILSALPADEGSTRMSISASMARIAVWNAFRRAGATAEDLSGGGRTHYLFTFKAIVDPSDQRLIAVEVQDNEPTPVRVSLPHVEATNDNDATYFADVLALVRDVSERAEATLQAAEGRAPKRRAS